MRFEFGAFAKAANLKNVTIPESVTWLESRSFNGSAITSIDIPASVTHLGHWAFENCADLTSVSLRNWSYNYSTSPYYGIYLFDFCDNLKDIYLYMETPPGPLGGGLFTNFKREECTLHVPNGTVAAYETSEWTGFKAIVEME
jgi:hypothetical protein